MTNTKFRNQYRQKITVLVMHLSRLIHNVGDLITYLFTNPLSVNEIANPFTSQASQSPYNHLVSIVHRGYLQSKRKGAKMWLTCAIEARRRERGKLVRFLAHLLIAIRLTCSRKLVIEKNASLALMVERGK